jgi:hypothetical protein
LYGQLVRSNYEDLIEPSARQSGLKLGFLLALREVAARQNQRQAAIPGALKDHGEGAVKGDL